MSLAERISDLDDRCRSDHRSRDYAVRRRGPIPIEVWCRRHHRQAPFEEIWRDPRERTRRGTLDEEAIERSICAWAPMRDATAAEASMEVRRLLREGLHLQARDAALRAAQQFPDDDRIGRLAGIFDSRNKARVNPDAPPQPDRSRDFAWLDNPPAWAHGQWVALVDGEVVAADESLREVDRALESIKPATPPLVHRVD